MSTQGSSIEITNQESIYKVLLYCINKKKLIPFSSFNELTLVADLEDEGANIDIYGRKIKILPNLLYKPSSGTYPFEYKGKKLKVTFTKGQTKITTNVRKIDSVKSILFTSEDPNPQIIKQLIDQALKGYGESSSDDMIIYENTGGAWSKSKDKKSRTLDSVILESNITEIVIEDMKQFIDSESWYKEMGVPYRRSYLFYGPPGTGKSSFAQALAGHLHFSICFLNVSDQMADYTFNSLLNSAPKKAIILIEDVDAMFEGRKNKAQANRLTYSGFLNALDGVRSQQGRIIIMTTNHKQRLDPALLRPGRIDNSFELSLSSKYQGEMLYKRFFGNEQAAKKFGELIPAKTFSMSQIQGFFVKYKRKPHLIIQNIQQLLLSEQNIKIQDWLSTINCGQITGLLKLDNIFNLSSLKNLPNQQIQKTVSGKLSADKTVRLIEALRNNNFKIQTNKEQYVHYCKLACPPQLLQQTLKQIQDDKYESLFHLKDRIDGKKSQLKAKQHIEANKAKAQKNKKNKKEQGKQKQKQKEQEKTLVTTAPEVFKHIDITTLPIFNPNP